MTDVSLAALRDDARRSAPNPPPTEKVMEDAGLQRLATYYLYSGLLAGVIGDDDLLPSRWPEELAEPMRRMGLSRLAPRTWDAVDAQLTAEQQASRRNRDRETEFARLLVDLINQGAFGPLCARADSVRLAEPSAGRAFELELLRGGRVVRTCPVTDHWELVAQYLAAAPLGSSMADLRSSAVSSGLAWWLKTSGLGHAVGVGTSLAVGLHPLGAVAGLGTRLVQTRIQSGRDEAGALHRLGQELRTLQAQVNRAVANTKPSQRS
jgi:hypothetical protein